MPKKAFRIRRQNGDGETLHAPAQNLCHSCYRPLEHDAASYCSNRCLEAHTRLKGAAA
jgi:hypothetical protein